MNTLIGSKVIKVEGNILFFEKEVIGSKNLLPGFDLIGINFKTDKEVSIYAVSDYYQKNKEKCITKVLEALNQHGKAR